MQGVQLHCAAVSSHGRVAPPTPLPPFTMLFAVQVCSDEFGWSFNNGAAAVVCRQLGLPLPALAIRGGVFGAGEHWSAG